MTTVLLFPKLRALTPVTPTLEAVPFEEFGKVPRLERTCVITEKLDGTNAQVLVLDDGNVIAGSRNRYLVEGQDNFGFRAWVEANKELLVRALGPGRHFGEWWGPGIQRGYGLKEKTFSLFNTARWTKDPASVTDKCFLLPDPLQVVPVLYAGPFRSEAVDLVLLQLEQGGSQASPGFMRPEGVCIYHTAGNCLFKRTLGDDGHKGGN